MVARRPAIGATKTDIRHCNGTWRVKVFRFQPPAFLTGVAPRWCVVACKSFQSAKEANQYTKRIKAALQRVHSTPTRCSF